MSIIEQSVRAKARFKTATGNLTTEDLYQADLVVLDTLAKQLNKEVKEGSEESFIKTKTSANKLVELKFEVVKHVIKIRLEEEEKRELAAEKRRKRARILGLIAQKEDEGLAAKGIDELRKELEETED